MLIVSSHLFLLPNDVFMFIIYSVSQSTIHKLHVCRRYQPTGFVIETSSIEVASRNIITAVHTVNKSCSFAPYKAVLHSISYSIHQLQSWRRVHMDTYICICTYTCIYRCIYKDKPGSHFSSSVDKIQYSLMCLLDCWSILINWGILKILLHYEI